MDYNALIDLEHEVQGQLWVDKVIETYQKGFLCQWISTFHPDQLSCQLGGYLHHGAFNAGLKTIFSDGTAWMVRFPRVGKIHHSYADEKTAMEVEALRIIRQGTTIPVPKVHAWGLAARNPLGLGPFIIMDFIDGVSLNDLLIDPSADPPTRLMKEDIEQCHIEFIYRQLANIMLQLFKLDFDRIGSLPWPETEAGQTSPIPPLTLKAHDILQTGGVDTLGNRLQSFATTTEYFQYVAGQDLEQLINQPNSIFGPYDARSKLAAFKALKSLIPDFINARYDHGKFKLICDDLGLGNLIVKSKDDLTVVGVVDLEWSYIGPAQLFGSAPWWLLKDRPVNTAWDCENDEPPKIAGRYFRCLETFKRVLEEEEAKLAGHEEKELSSLIKWSQETGAMWLHMLLSMGFNAENSFPFTQLRQHVGHAEWSKRKSEACNAGELDTFAVQKVHQLEQYDAELEQAIEVRA